MLKGYFNLLNRLVTSAVKCTKPGCDGTMVLRTNKATGQKFYGCSNFSNKNKPCKNSISVSTYENLEREQQSAAKSPAATEQGTARSVEQTPQSTQIKPKVFFLAISNSDDKPYAVNRHGESGSTYFVQSEDGQGRYYSESEMKVKFTSVRDDNNKAISNTDPKKLFEHYAKLNAKEEPPTAVVQETEKNSVDSAIVSDEEKKEKASKEKAVKGRIPADRISPYQKQIQDTYTEENKNIMINALAGSGKTTVLKHIASYKKPGEQWLYLVFNAKNAAESRGKFPDGVTVMTSHSFLGQQLKINAEDYKTFPQTYLLGSPQSKRLPMELQKHDKIESIVSQMFESEVGIPENLHDKAYETVVKLSNFAKNFAIKILEPTTNAISPSASQAIDDIITKYAINTTLVEVEEGEFFGAAPMARTDYRSQLIDLTVKALLYSVPGRCNIGYLNNIRDHNDTLWFPTLQSRLEFPKYDVVLADEVQDFNACQVYMLTKLSEAGARIVAVGDPNQSIYAFRGADSKSFNRVADVVQSGANGGIVHSLPKNYRSGKKIIEYVRNNTHVKDLEAGLDFDGEVTEGIKKEDAVAKLLQEFKKGNELQMPTAFISRTNDALIGTALTCLANDVDFAIMGVDLSKDLVNFIRENTSTFARFDKSLNYLQRIPIDGFPTAIYEDLAIFKRTKGKIPKYGAMIPEKEKTVTVIQSIVGNLKSKNYYDDKLRLTIRTAYDFVTYLKKKFASQDPEDLATNQERSPKDYIAFTTAHRSKGLEWDRVYLLEPQNFPSPLAKTEEEMQQESNAYYVALTRAMRELHVLAPSEKDKQTEASSNNQIGWYKRAQTLTPQQMQQYLKPQKPGSVKLIGSGLGATFSLPNLGITIRGGELMNKVLVHMQSELIKNNVHTIDTSPVAGSNILGVNRSNEPGIIHVDVPKIISLVQKQALPSITQLDGTKIDADAKRAIYEQMAQTILHQLADTTAHEAQHEIDYWKSLQTKGKFESGESGAQQAGHSAAERAFPIKNM